MQEFAIVFPGRCGSNLLARMLRRHPEIDASAYEAFAKEPLARGDRRPIAVDEDGATFARDVVYVSKRSGITAIGFKLAYHHARTPTHASVWDDLGARPVKVIHVTRRNPLDRLISHELAISQQKWVADHGERGIYQLRPVIIAFERLVADVAWLTRSMAVVRDLVPAARRHEVAYEDLAADPDAILQQTLAFLGVAPATIAPVTKRQRRFGQRAAVANYDALRASVRRHHPEWTAWFTSV